MITGDHLLTAEAISRECGISSALSQSICGAQLRALSPDKLSEMVADVSVVARSTPLDKHAVVSALQQRGEVVAVTGDGTNDVAALVQADIGLAMGRSGTELAKEASDIVVLDDDFRSIVAAVSWGRCIFNNVRRFLQFQLTANVVTLFISFTAAVVLHDTPFKAVQLLWVNLIMDSLGALALATGRPHEGLLARPPQRRRAPLISQFMIQNIAGQALFQVGIVTVLLIWHGTIPARSQHHYTLLFNVFVYCQMFNLINARVVEFGDSVVAGIMDNIMFVGIMLGIGVVQFLLVQFCGHFFACVPLTLGEHLLSLALAALSLPVAWAVRRSPESVIIKLLRPIRKFHTQWTRSVAA
jgi:Ca2+-transporting ATPase